MSATLRSATKVAAFIILGAITGLTTSLLLPQTYVSSATLRIQSPRGDANDSILSAGAQLLTFTSLRSIIEAEGMYRRELVELPMLDVTDKMREDIHIVRVGQAGAPKEVNVSFRYTDDAAAQRTTRALMDGMISLCKAEDGSPAVALELLQAPHLLTGASKF